MAKRGAAAALQYERRTLKLLQWRNPRIRWVLKSPDYMRYLPEVLKVFSDVRLIWTHRDPVKALGSMIDTMGTLFWMRTDSVRMAGALDHLTDPQVSAAMLSQPIDWLESGVLPRTQLCNIHYTDLIGDPVESVNRMYQFFGLQLADAARQAMTDYLRERPRQARPAHAYGSNATDFESRERQAYRRYQEYFNVGSEI
jgi:hypothetical protein